MASRGQPGRRSMLLRSVDAFTMGENPMNIYNELEQYKYGRWPLRRLLTLHFPLVPFSCSYRYNVASDCGRRNTRPET